MIAQRIAADDVLTAGVSAQASSDEAARAAICRRRPKRS